MFGDILTLVPADRLAAFLVAALLLNLTPGADVMFATASGVAGGPRAGALAGLGVGFGGLWHVGLATLGLSAMLAAHPSALTFLKWGGAAYLAVLAWQAWHAPPLRPGSARPAEPGLRLLWRGFLTNALNPKVALFVLAFLPQFTDPARGPVWAQMLLLGTLFTLTGTLVTMGYGALAGILGQRLALRMSGLNKLAAGLFGLLALRLVWD